MFAKFVERKPEKLYSTSCVGRKVNPLGVITHWATCSLVRWDFVHTLEIIYLILSEVVNRERLCGTNALLSVASVIFGAVRPLAEVLTLYRFITGSFV